MSNCFYSLLMKYAPAATSMPSVVIRSGETRGVEVGEWRGARAGDGSEIAKDETRFFSLPFFPPIFSPNHTIFILLHTSLARFPWQFFNCESQVFALNRAKNINCNPRQICDKSAFQRFFAVKNGYILLSDHL